jgi:hypothetical protein
MTHQEDRDQSSFALWRNAIGDGKTWVEVDGRRGGGARSACSARYAAGAYCAAAPQVAFSCTIRLRLVSAECAPSIGGRESVVAARQGAECETRTAAPLTRCRCAAGSRRRSARRCFPVQGCSTEVHLRAMFACLRRIGPGPAIFAVPLHMCPPPCLPACPPPTPGRMS